MSILRIAANILAISGLCYTRKLNFEFLTNTNGFVPFTFLTNGASEVTSTRKVFVEESVQIQLSQNGEEAQNYPCGVGGLLCEPQQTCFMSTKTGNVCLSDEQNNTQQDDLPSGTTVSNDEVVDPGSVLLITENSPDINKEPLTRKQQRVIRKIARDNRGRRKVLPQALQLMSQTDAQAFLKYRYIRRQLRLLIKQENISDQMIDVLAQLWIAADRSQRLPAVIRLLGDIYIDSEYDKRIPGIVGQSLIKAYDYGWDVAILVMKDTIVETGLLEDGVRAEVVQISLAVAFQENCEAVAIAFAAAEAEAVADNQEDQKEAVAQVKQATQTWTDQDGSGESFAEAVANAEAVVEQSKTDIDLLVLSDTDAVCP